jgi:hypothetical protein
MGWRAGAQSKTEAGADAAGARGASTRRTGSKRGIFWILAGLVATGVAAGYGWLKGLPRD